MGLLLACSMALSARAEVGSYPSANLLLGILFLYTLGIPIAIAAAAYAVLKLIRRQIQPKWKVLFAAALLVWDTGLTLYFFDVLKLPFADDAATLLGIAAALGTAAAFGFWTAPAPPIGAG